MLAAALLSIACSASALTKPGSYVGVGCSTSADAGLDSVGPAPGIFSLARDRAGTSTWPPPGGDWLASAQSLTAQSVTEAGGGVGLADDTASVLVNGVLNDGTRAVAEGNTLQGIDHETAT